MFFHHRIERRGKMIARIAVSAANFAIDKPYSYHKIQYPHSWYLSKRVQNLSIHIVLNKDVSSGLIHNHQILEATKMSFKG